MRHFSASLQALAAGALFLTTGCSPSVYTSIQKSYPARIEGSTVLVYDMADSLPEPAEILGSVTVKDSGFSVNCNYAKVMQRAKDETNKIGGNGLHLFWHKEPSALGSSCHRIAAHMLLLPDSVYTASYFDNVAAQNARLAAYGLIPADGTVAPGRETPKAANNNTLTFNAGYAFITSDFYLPAGASGNPKQGLDINAAYQWTSRIGIGFGLRYSGYFTSVMSEGAKLKVRLHYFAPEFVLRQEAGRNRRWAFHESVGLGYARYTEQMGSLSGGIGGLGFHVEVGFEYKLTQNVGIGASVGAYGTRFSSMDDAVSQYDDDQKGGISRISLNGGLRFYF